MKKDRIGKYFQVLLIPLAVLMYTSLSLAQYAIDLDVLSGGGGESRSDNYILFDTLGQSSPIGTSNSTNYVNHAGFWYLFLPDISVNPTPYDFQRVFIDQSSSPRTFTISNPGTGDLAIETLTGSAEFELRNDHCSRQVLAPTESCTFDVIFSPTSLGKKTATISIPSNDPDDPDGKMEVSVTGRGVLLMVNPEEGTIGTMVEIEREGLGSKKGKVVMQSNGVNYALKVLEWNVGGSNVIRGQMTTAIVGGAVCDVVVQPKGTPFITEPGGFTVKLPEIGTVTPPSASPLGEVRIAGKFFGTKKGKVYLEQGGVAKACKVLSWAMGEIRFQVPKKYPSGTYTLKVTNKVGTGTANFQVTD